MKLTIEIRGNSVTAEFEPNPEYASDVISVMAAAVEKLDAIQAAESGAADAAMRLYEDMVKGYDEKKLRCEALEADVEDRDKRIEALKGLVLEAEATVKARECRIGELEVLLASRDAAQKPCWEAEPPFKIGSFVMGNDQAYPNGTFAVERVRNVSGRWQMELSGLCGWWPSEKFISVITFEQPKTVSEEPPFQEGDKVIHADHYTPSIQRSLRVVYTVKSCTFSDSEGMPAAWVLSLVDEDGKKVGSGLYARNFEKIENGPEIESTDRYGKPLVVGDIVKANGIAYAFAGGNPLGLTVAYINDPDKILLFKNSDVEFVKHADDRI